MSQSSQNEIKKYLSNAIYLIVILFILLMYYKYIFKRNLYIIKSHIEHQYISEMQMKALLLDNEISKSIQGAKSISSRSSIKNKITEYEHNIISFDSLKSFTSSKYKEGIKAIEQINWARRYIHSKILIEDGTCKNIKVDSLLSNHKSKLAKVYLYKKDSTFNAIVTSPIIHDKQIIGHDIICFNYLNVLNKIKDPIIDFNITYTPQQSDNKLIYFETKALCNIKSEHTNAYYQFAVSQNILFYDLNTFYNHQTLLSLLLLISSILIIYIFHRKKQLISLKKSDYFEMLAAQKTKKLNKTVLQLLELNKQKEESEKRFKTIYEDNRSIMLIINPFTYHIEDANKAALEFYGYSKSQITNLKIYDLNQLPTEKVKNEINTVIVNHKAYFNFKHKLQNGDIRDVEVYSSPIKINNEIKLISIIHDITERKLYREKIEKLNIELSESIKNHELLENKLKAVVDISPIAIIMSTGSDQKIDYLNPVFIKLFGYNKNDITSIPEWWSYAIKDKELSVKITHEWNERVRRANKNNTKIYPIEVEVTCKDGSKKNIKWGYISTGIQNWAFGMDLTELRITEKHLRKAKVKVEKDALLLKELNATKDKFFRIVAHDLKSPFNAILGFTSTLLHNINLYTSEEIKEYVKIIDDSARNTYGLLENLLNWSQAQTGKTIYKPDHIDVSKVLIKTIQQLDSVASAKNIKILFDTTIDLSVHADENMLNTVLRNLVNNAIKFTQEGGQIEINAIQNDTHIVFIVKDNGIGMTKNLIDKLFKIEEKVSTKGTNNESGTGLGLLLANEFIKKHNGNIHVESELGKGSIFKILLPLN